MQKQLFLSTYPKYRRRDPRLEEIQLQGVPCSTSSTETRQMARKYDARAEPVNLSGLRVGTCFLRRSYFVSSSSSVTLMVVNWLVLSRNCCMFCSCLSPQVLTWKCLKRSTLLFQASLPFSVYSTCLIILINKL